MNCFNFERFGRGGFLTGQITKISSSEFGVIFLNKSKHQQNSDSPKVVQYCESLQ